MIKYKKKISKENVILAGFMMMAILSYPLRAYAAESVMIPLEVPDKDIVSVELPVIRENEDSPFDYLIDPQGLLYETGAIKYGGGKVDENATILFRNHDGEYDFSRHSDQLVVTNRSNVPVTVTISAGIENVGDAELVQSDDFTDSEERSIYLALVDDRGSRIPLSEDEDVSISVQMNQAPDNAYINRIDEETQSYEYVFSANPDEIEFDTYSFGLEGACNPNGEWQNISVCPKVSVTWKVEPILTEEDEELLSEPVPEEDTLTTKDSEATKSDSAEKIDETEEPVVEENDGEQEKVEIDEAIKEDSQEVNANEDEDVKVYFNDEENAVKNENTEQNDNITTESTALTE